MKSLARFFSPTSFGCVAAIVVALIPGCPSLNPPVVKLEILAVVAPENGGELFDDAEALPQIESRFEFLPTNTTSSPFGGLEVRFAGSDGRAVPHTSLVSQQFLRNTAPPTAFIELQLGPATPIRPIYVSLIGSTASGISARSKSYPIYLHRPGMGPAPRITSVTAPDRIERRTQPTITVTGVNFTGASIVMEDAAGIAVLAQSVDTNTNTLTATLDVKTEAQTGFSSFYIETPAGGSQDRSLFIAEPRPLEIFEAYPNYLTFGAPVEVTLAGQHFHAGMSLVSIPDFSLVPGEPAFVDSHTVRSRVTVRTIDPDTPALLARGIGGEDSIILPAKPRSFKGPRIARVMPREIVAGTRDVQIEVEGVNFDVNAPSGFGALRNETVGELFVPGDGRQVLPRSPSATHRVVLLTQPDAMARPGPFDLFVATAGGWKTNVAPMELVAPPAAPRPFASHAQTGRIPRDGVARADTIFGARLTGVQRVSSNTPGLEVIGFTQNAGGTSLGVMVRALPTTPLTGDARTVFKIDTQGGTSNEVGYLVEEGGTTPGGPQIDGLFPNWISENYAPEFWIHGQNFAANSTVAFVPPDSVDVVTAPIVADARNLALQYQYFSDQPLAVRVVTPGVGQSAAVNLVVVDPAVGEGPEIFFVSQSAIAGARAQITIPGNKLFEGGETTVVSLPSVAHGDLITGGIFVPNGNPGFFPGVVELQVAELPASAPNGATARFALRRGDGLTTFPISVDVQPAPAGKPFVSRAVPVDAGDFRRGTTRRMRITGRGLMGASGFNFQSGGVTPGIITVIDDTEIQVDFTAAANAELTGDYATNFTVRVGNLTSNDASYVLRP